MAMDFKLDLNALLPSKTNTTTTATTSGTSTQQRVLSQEAINKLIYDSLSADNGVAALATGENLGGGYAASTKALLTQDFMTKLIGELAQVTAPVVTTSEQQQQTSSSSSKKLTVICTELNRQGLLSDDLYFHPAVVNHFESLPDATVAGYRIWGNWVAQYIADKPQIAKALAPIAIARYKMITTGQFSFLGWFTIAPAQWICNRIGRAMSKQAVKEYAHGYVRS